MQRTADPFRDWDTTLTLRIVRPVPMRAYCDLAADEGPRASALMNLAFAGYSLASFGADRLPVDRRAPPPSLAAAPTTAPPVPVARALPRAPMMDEVRVAEPLRIAPAARSEPDPSHPTAPLVAAIARPRAAALIATPVTVAPPTLPDLPQPIALPRLAEPETDPVAVPAPATDTPSAADGVVMPEPTATAESSVAGASLSAPGAPRQTADGVEFQVAASLNGRRLGRVALLLPDSLMGHTDRVSEDIYVRLGDILDVLQQKLDPERFRWLRSSEAAQRYVSLNDLRAHGIVVGFDRHDALAFKVR